MPQTTKKPATASTATGSPNITPSNGVPRSIISYECKLDMLERQIVHLVTLLSLQAQAMADEDTDTLDYVREQLIDWRWRIT